MIITKTSSKFDVMLVVRHTYKVLEKTLTIFRTGYPRYYLVINYMVFVLGRPLP
jgi:hypothetical protein